MRFKMHTIPASEVKRRGITVLEEALKNGPIHIIKNSRLACVVLSEEDYADLLRKANLIESSSLWSLLGDRPWVGKRNKDDIDQQIKVERGGWKK